MFLFLARLYRSHLQQEKSFRKNAFLVRPRGQCSEWPLFCSPHLSISVAPLPPGRRRQASLPSKGEEKITPVSHQLSECNLAGLAPEKRPTNSQSASTFSVSLQVSGMPQNKPGSFSPKLHHQPHKGTAYVEVYHLPQTLSASLIQSHREDRDLQLKHTTNEFCGSRFYPQPNRAFCPSEQDIQKLFYLNGRLVTS